MGREYVQGIAGEENSLTVALLDVLGQRFGGSGDVLNATLTAVSPEGDLLGESGGMLGVVSAGSGLFEVQWVAEEATPANGSLLYRIDVFLGDSSKVYCMLHNP